MGRVQDAYWDAYGTRTVLTWDASTNPLCPRPTRSRMSSSHFPLGRLVALLLQLVLCRLDGTAALSSSTSTGSTATTPAALTLTSLLASGALRRHDRPVDYVERRQDGYQEPRTIYVLGTNHRSPTSAAAVSVGTTHS